MNLDLLRMGVVFVHLMACCIAVGTVFMSDLDVVRRLLGGSEASLDPGHLTGLHNILVRALLVLWLTGSGLVAMDVWAKGYEVLGNPKLQSKIAIVVLLTINGVVLHQLVLPMLKKAGALMRLTFSRRLLAIFFGAVSAVSWFYAAMLGVGRPLNWKYSLVEIMAAYPVLVIGGFAAMTILTAWAQYVASGGTRAFERPRRPSF